MISHNHNIHEGGLAEVCIVLTCAPQVEHDCSFYSDLGADLFMFMELVSKIEDEFGKNVSSPLWLTNSNKQQEAQLLLGDRATRKHSKDCWNGRGNDNLGWNDLKMDFKVIKSGTNRKIVYDFLLVVYSNFCNVKYLVTHQS